MSQHQTTAPPAQPAYFLMRKGLNSYLLILLAGVIGVCWATFTYTSLLRHWLWGVSSEVVIFNLSIIPEWWLWLGLAGIVGWAVWLGLKVYQLLPVSWRWELLPNYQVSEDLDPEVSLATVVQARPKEIWVELSLILVGIVGGLWYAGLLMSGWYWNEQGVHFRAWPDFKQQTLGWDQPMRLVTKVEDLHSAGVLLALVLQPDDGSRTFRFWGQGQALTDDPAELIKWLTELETRGVKLELIEDWPAVLPKSGNKEAARGYWSMYAQLVEWKKAQKIEQQRKIWQHQAEVLAVYNLGLEAWLDRKDYRTAAKYYQQALDLEADFVPALASLGYVQAQFMGKAQEGEVMMKKAMALDPTYAYAPFNLAIFYNLHGRSAEARELIELVVTQFQSHPDIGHFKRMHTVMQATWK